jgi:hypothetical protein
LSAALDYSGLYVLLGLIVAVAILVAVYAAYRLRRHAKAVAAGFAVVLVAVAAFAAVYYSEPAINYWLMSTQSTWAQDNMVTMIAENRGFTTGTFDLMLKFSNAHFSQKTSPPYTKVDDQTVKFTFTLQPGEQQNRTAWFIINQNVTDFGVSISFQPSGILMHGEPGGVDYVSYQKDEASGNFTLHTFVPPP